MKVEEFLDLIRRSELIDGERLKQAVSQLEQPISDSSIVSAALIRLGLLTEWQNEKLLAGRYKGFFLGKYKILQHLGTGGMSSVYKAEHRMMRHIVAIKVLPKNLVQQSSYLERFHQEARAAAQLNHPNMVRAFDVDKEGDTYYLVMEYVDGTDIKEIVARDGALSFKLAAEYARQAAEGLAYAHLKGIIHRDIKPANLLVDKTGTVKILDLGLVRFSDDGQGSLTVAYDENMIGTVDYLSPEQAMNSHAVDARADIYSLGCTLYFMLTGNPPFPEGTIPQRVMMHQTKEPESIRKKRPDAPEGLLAICSRMMAKSPEARFQCAADVVTAIAHYLGGSDVLGRGSDVPKRGSDVYLGGIGSDAFRRPGGSGVSPASPGRGDVGDEDLSLAPLDDDPVQKPASTATLARDKAKAAAGAAEKAKASSGAATKPAVTDKPAKSQPGGMAPVADEFDELMTDTSAAPLGQAGADWNAGSPLFQARSDVSIARLITVGVVLGLCVVMLAIAFIWFTTR